MRSAWNIGDWGEACGPRPSGGGAAGGVATITQQGNELSIQGPSRTYSTTQCWEQFPGMSISSHSGGKRGWRTICKTAAGDPRQATITTNLIATDTHINFDEVGQYQFVVKKQNCTASVRRSRTFRLIQRAGEPSEAEKRRAEAAEPEPKPESKERQDEAQEPDPEPAPRQVPVGSACASPGPPARLEVRPAEKLIRSGETFSFRTTVLDAEGCRLSIAPRWRLDTPDSPAHLLGSGRVQVAEDAPEGPIALQVSIGNKSVKVRLQVVSSTRYDELLETEAFDSQGESKRAAVAIIASGGIGAGTAVAGESDWQLKLLVLGALAGLAFLLGLLGILLVRRSRKPTPKQSDPLEKDAPPPPTMESRMVCPTCGQDYGEDRSFCPNDGNRLVRAEATARRDQGGICPTCGQGYDPGIDKCPEHGEELVPAAVYRSSRASEARPTRKICPICGTQYPGNAGFCGRDGAQLVPVN